jgi:hypothetical protein
MGLELEEDDLAKEVRPLPAGGEIGDGRQCREHGPSAEEEEASLPVGSKADGQHGKRHHQGRLPAGGGSPHGSPGHQPPAPLTRDDCQQREELHEHLGLQVHRAQKIGVLEGYQGYSRGSAGSDAAGGASRRYVEEQGAKAGHGEREQSR